MSEIKSAEIIMECRYFNGQVAVIETALDNVDIRTAEERGSIWTPQGYHEEFRVIISGASDHDVKVRHDMTLDRFLRDIESKENKSLRDELTGAYHKITNLNRIIDSMNERQYPNCPQKDVCVIEITKASRPREITRAISIKRKA